MTIMVSSANEESAAMIFGTIITSRNILASAWASVIPGDTECLLLWVRAAPSVIPVESDQC